tara:strand:+ start:167 stop:550 length:384 start_codon:yes stop_codon:yes gene_type:complete
MDKSMITVMAAVIIVAIMTIIYSDSPAPTQYNEMPVILSLDSLSLKHAFNIQRQSKGNDAQFYWRGNYYKTNLMEDQMNDGLAYHYMVKFTIANEKVNKLFDDETQANTFAEMVNGTVVKFSSNSDN